MPETFFRQTDSHSLFLRKVVLSLGEEFKIDAGVKNQVFSSRIVN